jgi:small subunit ribosomal protein S8
MTDPIADMIIRIKNALLSGHKEVVLPHSKMKESIARILKENHYVEDFAVQEAGAHKNLQISLRYVNKMPAISDVKRISKPGRRNYVSADQVPRTLNGYGLTILSTSAGVMDDKTARKKNVGGELLCKIW